MAITDNLKCLSPESYEMVKQSCFAWGDCPDGFFGERIDCGYSLLGTTVLCVTESGYHNAGMIGMSSEKEALWYLLNDSRYKRFSVKEIVERLK